jgi:hypothetical protein
VLYSTAMRDRTLEELWRDAPPSTRRFDPNEVTHLPPTAQRYFRHTLAPGARCSASARLEMHGTIKLGDAWQAFTATQVLCWDRGFVWHAHTHMKGLPISGSDVEIDGEGAMRWKLLGIIPVMHAEGPEISRSAIGRLHAEAIWLPAALLGPEVTWSEGPRGPAFTVDAHGEQSHVELDTDADGRLRAMKLARWGNVDGGDFRYIDFGGSCTADREFDGVTIPTEYRIGWYFGSDRFEPEGEFFRCTIDGLVHR